LFGGYSFIGGDPFSVGHRVGLNGWEGAIDINFLRWLRVVADFGGNYGTSHIPIAFTTPFPPCTPLCPGTFDTFPVSTHQYTYEFGADFPYRRWDKIVPYGQALFGRAHVTGTANGIGETRGTKEYDSKFSMLLGMGFDYNISPRFAWRLQADYLQTKFFGNTEDNYRVSTGIVWKITRRKKKRTLVTP
jgi:opacity protein-like surface antigen